MSRRREKTYQYDPRLPLDWGNWQKHAKRVSGFIRWATAPSGNRPRYAIRKDAGHLVWLQVYPSGDHGQQSGGAFYDEMHPKGAVASAVQNARKHARKMAAT